MRLSALLSYGAIKFTTLLYSKGFYQYSQKFYVELHTFQEKFDRIKTFHIESAHVVDTKLRAFVLFLGSS